MSKGLEPEDCLRGHQIIPTARIEAMLEREGFNFRYNRGGTSHLRYIHRDYPEIAFNVIAGTDKRDSQVNAAKAVQRARALKTSKTKPSRRELWLRAVAGKIDSCREDFEIGQNAFTVVSHDYPCLGIEIPFDLSSTAAAQKIEMLRRQVQDFTGLLSRFAGEYGVETQRDDDGILHPYLPQWRVSIGLKAFGAEDYQDPFGALTQWETVLREYKKMNDKDAALHALEDKLRKRWPQDEVFCSAGRIIVRDGTCPEIGMLVYPKNTENEIAWNHQAMKADATRFAARIGQMENEYEFNTRRGEKTTFYLNHAVYESMSAIVRRFNRTGDNDIAFAVLDKLEAAVRVRDADFKADENAYANIRKMCVGFKQTEIDGMIVTEGAYCQIGTRRRAKFRVVDTKQGRRSIHEEAQFAQTLLSLQIEDYERAVRNMGYRTEKLPDGTLRMTHALYENLTFDLPDFEGSKATIPTLKALADQCIRNGPGADAAVARYMEAHNRVTENFLSPVVKACQGMYERFAAIHPEFTKLEAELVQNRGFVRTLVRGQGYNHTMYYGISNGKPAISVPVARIFNHQGEDVYIVTEKTLQAMRVSIRELNPTCIPFNAPKSPVAVSLSALISPAAQKDVKGAHAAVFLAGMRHP